MAKQQGIISISGKLGSLTFFRKNGKAYVKSTSKKAHLLSEGSKRSGREFGMVSSDAAKIRRAFAPLVKNYGDDNLINRLNTCMIKILKTAPLADGTEKDGQLVMLRC